MTVEDNISFDVKNNYWVLNDGRIYSSATANFVSSDDSRFRAWVAEGNFVTPCPDETTLYGILAEFYPQGLKRDSAEWALYLKEAIRREADTRIALAIEARNLEHAQEAISTGNSRAIGIAAKKLAGVRLTPTEIQAEFVYGLLFEFIRMTKDRQVELEEQLDEDFRNDSKWPSITP